MKKLLISLACLAAFGTGCKTFSGPVVTNVSADGNGNLIIEKNVIVFDNTWNTIGIGEKPTIQIIRISPEAK